MTDVAVDETVLAVGSLVESQARLKAVALEYGAGQRAIARADPERLQQIILNLLSNALKATDSGGRIVLSWETDERDVRIQVMDDGIGIPADKLEAIYDPFVQVDLSSERSRQGTGLGLSISRDLARGMGGDLSVRSVSGEGSTFTLALRGA